MLCNQEGRQKGQPGAREKSPRPLAKEVRPMTSIRPWRETSSEGIRINVCCMSSKQLRSSHCRKISPLRSSPLRGLPSTRSRRVWTAFRSCPRHHHSLHKPLSVLPNQRYKKKPRPEYSQEQKAPLQKSWFILFSAFTV